MRITESMRIAAATTNQAKVTERLVELTRQASTGLRVEAPSDDAVAWSSAQAKSGRIEVLNARREGATRAQGDLELAESTLASSTDVLVRARELALQMSSGDMDASQRAMAAKEVTQLRQALVGLANTRGSRGYLFGGTKTDTPPFTTTGAFAGNDGVMNVEIADGVSIASNASGAKAFTAAGGRDVLADLADLQTALAANDLPGIQALLDPLEADRSQLVTARTEAGLGLDRFRSATDVTGAALVAVQSARARETEVDPAQVYSDLTNARAAYERSLAVTKEILALSSVQRS